MILVPSDFRDCPKEWIKESPLIISHNISSIAQVFRRLFLINLEILIETNFHRPRPIISGICKRNDRSAGSS